MTQESAAPKTNKPMLGMLSLVCLIVGNMIGIGLYVGSFYSMLSLQDARLVLLVWFVGGLYALCGAIAYGAVARRLPVSGGEYTYLSRCVHPAIGFIAGWISIIAGFTAPIAGAALLFGEYLNRFLGEGYSDLARIFASLAIVAAAALHLLHVKVGAGFNNVVIGIKLVCFLVFLAIGVPFAMRSGYSGLLVDAAVPVPESLSFTNRLMDGNTVYNMIVSLFYVSLAYTGFNASIYLAGEIDREPNTQNGRSLVSRSMWMACLLVMIFYLLLNFVFLFGLDAQSIVDGGESYVALVANNIGGPSLSILIQITIILSAATSILAMMATGPMVYAQMAKDGYLPKWLGATSQVPRLPILIQASLCCVLVWISEIKDIVGYLGLTLTACGALAVSSIWFAKKAFQGNLPVRWYEHACTAIYVLGAILFLVVAAFSQREFNQFLLCMASFAAGLFVYVLVKWL